MIWLFLAIGAYLGIISLIAWMSLHPLRTPLFISPGIMGTPQEELEVPSTDGVRLKCWWVPVPGARTVAILCHGYVMNRSELSPVAHWLWQRGVSSLLIEFRAHGKTTGGVSTIGYREAGDVAAAVAEARRLAPGARILLIGSSMGSAACAFAIGNGTGADAVVLDSCYSRLVSASFGWWRFLGGPFLSAMLGPTVLIAGPLARINPFRIDVAKAIAKCPCPALVLHGAQDNLALPSEAKRNVAALGDRAETVWFENCGHSEFRWIESARYYAVMESFLIRHGLIESRGARDLALV